MITKWERRDSKRRKRSSNFKFKDYDIQEKESAKRMSKQKRAWAALHKESEFYDEDDTTYHQEI